MSIAGIYQQQIDAMSTMLDNVLSEIDDDTLARRPGPELNPLGFIYFHILRVWDLDLNVLIHGRRPSEDAWHRGGHSESMGYNPDGKGGRGAGNGFGYTDEEVDEIPYRMEPLRRYHEQLLAETRAYLAGADEAELTRETTFMGQPSSTGLRAQHVVAHSWNHIGEMRLSKGLLGFADATTPARARAAV
ncbi:MAG TPA: DinB family protein [Thermomicrobiales bacterium]|nr:DinB family protein [Thermomicrobiales bacterium]